MDKFHAHNFGVVFFNSPGLALVYMVKFFFLKRFGADFCAPIFHLIYIEEHLHQGVDAERLRATVT